VKRHILIQAVGILAFTFLLCICQSPEASVEYPVQPWEEWEVKSGSNFGDYRDWAPGYHPGIDLNLSSGPNDDLSAPVYAIADGEAFKIDDLGSNGWCIVIKHTSSGQSFTIPARNTPEYQYEQQSETEVFSVYIHIQPVAKFADEITVPNGTKVKKGEIIGHIMDPGGGPHLHFEIRSSDAQHSNGGSMLLPISNWAPNGTANTNGHYLNMQDLVASGARHPLDFLQANVGNGAPHVSNIHAGQRAGTKLVDIAYDVDGPDGDLLTITVLVSDDGGSTFAVTAGTFTGDVGSGITPDTGRRIAWDAGADVPNIYGANYRVKITASNGQTAGETIIGQGNAPMALIPAGEFQMGDSFNEGNSNERPRHKVYLDAFYIDVHEVTNAQYQKFMDVTGHGVPEHWSNSKFNAPDHPVVGVSWFDAVAYAEWAGKRLPTEAEWEKAARGGLVGKRYPWGDEISYDDANYSGTGGKDSWFYTSPVRYFAPNGYGLYDMAGNAGEWCADWYAGDYYASLPYDNPWGADSGYSHVWRGGSWYNKPDYLRVAYRSYSSPALTYPYIGFRCVAQADTDVGNDIEHSALSNVFTLDTSDTNDYKVVPLEPDPNPSEPAVMSGGICYLYYRVVDAVDEPVMSVIADFTVNETSYTSPPTGEDGMLVIPVEATDSQPGDVRSVSITHVGSTMLTTPLTARVAVIPRSYQHVWGLGKSMAGKVGVAVGGKVYVKGETEAGISYALNERDELIVGRTAELGGGGGIGVSTPGVKLTIGATQAGALAEAHAEIILYSLFSDEYLLSDRHEREQQMAQSALLVSTIMHYAGATTLPFMLRLTNFMVEHSLFDYGYYRTKESVVLGAQINAGASAFAGISLGEFTSDGKQQPVGMSLQGVAGFMLGAEVEHIKYYEESVHIATGYAMSQMLETELEIAAHLGTVGGPVKLSAGYNRDDVYASAGINLGKYGSASVFAMFGIDKLSEFREEYLVDTHGEPLRFLFSMGDLKRTITFVVTGEDIAGIQQSVANLVAFLAISIGSPDGEIQIGPDAIVAELRSLLDKFATLNIAYMVTEGVPDKIYFPLSLDVSLVLDFGISFEIEASESIDRTTLEGVFLSGTFFPQASYADDPRSSAELTSIINDALKGSWEIVKDKFRWVAEKVVAGAEAVVEAVATTVEGGTEVVKGSAKLVAKFSRDVKVEVITWGEALKDWVTPAPAGPMTKYQQALARATTPVVGGYYQFAPEGETFMDPGTLIISYTDDEVAQLGINEESLRISYWNPAESLWISVGGEVNTIDNSVTATITALHLYAITFDATPPSVGQLIPPPDSVITDPQTVIRARIVDDTDQLDTSSIVVLLDDVEVFYIFDGEFVTHAPISLSVGKHIVTIKAGDLFGNMAEQTWSFTLRNPSAAPWDVDGNGIVDIFDLVLIGSAFGTSEDETPLDVNSDGTIDIVDLIIVAMHYGETTKLPTSSAPRSPSNIYMNALEQWLSAAKIADDGSETFRRGITILEQLLSAIVPEQTVLLQNYPNPFNPDTWIPYQLSEASEVSITIYDATGRIVRKLGQGYKLAGTYRTQANAAHWDGRNEIGESVASGVYFVLLKAGEYQQIRRIVLVK